MADKRSLNCITLQVLQKRVFAIQLDYTWKVSLVF